MSTAPPKPPLRPNPVERFLAWVAGVGVARSEGWIGGVCAGIAARLRIDPLIVRGIFVVATVLGLPLIFLYAVIWAILPDADGTVHLRELLARRYSPAQWGILLTAVIGLLPTYPILASFGGFALFAWNAFGVFLFILGLALTIVLLVLIVRAARRAPGSDAPLHMASAGASAPDASADGSGTVTDARERGADAPPVTDTVIAASAPADFVSAADPTPQAPPPPAASASADELAAWRVRHDAWKEQEQAWRRQQQDAERAAKDQARLERQQVAAQFAAEAAERRRLRRASKPRARFAFVATALGVALVAGAVVGLRTGGDPVLASALGFLAAALVLALSMIIAGVLRRRSGFLAFLTAVALTVGGITGTAAVMLDEHLVLGDSYANNASATNIRQPFGYLEVSLLAGHNLPGSDGSEPITIEKNLGTTHITVEEGVTLDLTGTFGAVTVEWESRERLHDGGEKVVDFGEWKTPSTPGAFRKKVASAPEPDHPKDASTVVPVSLTQESGEVLVTYYVDDSADDDQKKDAK